MANEEFLESLPGIYESQLNLVKIADLLNQDAEKMIVLSEKDREKLKKDYEYTFCLLNFSCYNTLPI
jgi:hypothetical protein